MGEGIIMKMECNKIEFGSYKCATDIELPWVHKDMTGDLHNHWNVMVDKCLVPEILSLWKLGIKTDSFTKINVLFFLLPWAYECRLDA